MTIVVGYSLEDHRGTGLDLAHMMAGSAGLPMVVVCVIPDRWQSVSLARSNDLEYQTHLRGLAEAALGAARRHLGQTGVDVRYEVVRARSSPAGLLTAAAQHDARILVAGSSSQAAWGHIALGSVTDRLLHSSQVPVALTPRGFRGHRDAQVSRITVAHDGSATCADVLRRAADVAADLKAALRVVTFAVRPGQMLPSEVGLRAEDEVVDVWRSETTRRITSAVEQLGPRFKDTEHLVAHGRTWADALDVPQWSEGDVLVVGSSAEQPLLERVFLGSTAARIVRHSPVPVVVVP